MRRAFARLTALLVVLLAVSAWTASAPALAACERVAAPGGSDGAPGTAEAPFATVQRLADALSPGQTGCLRAGAYAGDVKVTGPAITLTSYPGERALIQGRIRIMQTADGATVTRLDIDGRNVGNLPGPIVLADDVTFSYNDITNYNTDICLIVGAVGWEGDALARRFVFDHNRIHDCGARPSTNKHHALYLQHTEDARITDNVIYDNVDRGIQLYTSAQRTLVRGNIIDGNGEGIIFSGAGGLASSDNVVEGNLITFPTIRYAIESYWPAGNPVGTGNVARANCVFGDRTIGPQLGFTALSNLIVDPLYVDRAGHDYRLSAGSPCAAILGSADPPAAPDALSAAGAVTAPTPPTPPAPAPGGGGGGGGGGGSVTLAGVSATALSPTTAIITGTVTATASRPIVEVDRATATPPAWVPARPVWTAPAKTGPRRVSPRRTVRKTTRRFKTRVRIRSTTKTLRVRARAGQAASTVSVKLRKQRKQRKRH